jgi:flagellar basal body-associated protein FliL
VPLKILGKVLFPREAEWQRKKQIGIILWVILTALVFAVAVAAVMMLQNSRR